MSKTPLRFRSIDIKQMPGFPNGLYHYDDLHDRINIIAGPNASGKSSTAAALQQIIWPSLGKELQAEARIAIGEERWLVEKKLSRTTIQHEGHDKDLPSRPSKRERRRYILSLHDLVQVEDKELAQLIVQESVGGYDLDQAKEALEYSDHISNRSSKPYKQYQKADEKYEQRRKEQSALRDEYRHLEELQKRKAKAKEAESEAELYKRCQQYREAKKQFEEVRQKLEDFPDGLEHASGDEADRLVQIKNSIQDKENENKSLEQKIEETKKQLSEIDLPEEGMGKRKIDLLSRLATRLQSLQDTIDEYKRRLKEEKEKSRVALRSLDVEIDENNWNGVSSVDLSELEEWVQQAFQVTGRHQLLEQELEQLQKKNAEDSPDKEEVKQGIKLLMNWVEKSSKDDSTRTPAWGIPALVLTGIATGLATYYVGPFGLGGIIILMLLGGYLWWYRTSPKKNSEGRKVIEDYKKTGLPAPKDWSVGQVVEILDQLTTELEKSHREERRRMRIDQLEADLDKVESGKLQQIASQRNEWLEQLGTAPDVLEEAEDGYSRFYWFINRLNRWQKAHEEVEGYEQGLMDLRESKDEVLKRIKEEISFLDDTLPDQPEDVAALVNELDRREQRRREAVRTIESHRQQLRRNQREIKQLQERADKIGKKFGLDHPDVEEVERRVKQLKTYQKRRKEYNQAEFNLSQTLQSLEDHPLYEVRVEKLNQLSTDQLEREQEQMEKKAEEREALERKIQDIKTRVDQVRERHDLEEALQEKEEMANKLEDLYQENINAITGNLLIKKIKRITRNQNRPAVFNRASQLFNRITGGRYELQIEEGENRFKAYDNIRSRGFGLNQLSTGTRIQLLLSVRLAFIETQEQEIQLPIIADELLANSDEVRARSIIEALVQMSKEGRQIFYFTAQADEVHKWRSFLKEQNQDFQLYEIGQETSGTFAFYASYRPPADSLRMVGQVPDPDTEDHNEYGKQLNIPSFDLLGNQLDQLHLWYVIENVMVLYECLSRDIRFWGGLRSYLEYGGEIPGLGEEQWNRLQDRIEWLKRFQELYKQGRPRPIDRSVIEDTDAITDNFLESVDEKLQEVKGNPNHLLAALRNGEVPRFQKAKIHELREYLLRHGYIDEQDPLTLGDIHSRLQAYVDQLDITREEAQRLIDRVLSD